MRPETFEFRPLPLRVALCAIGLCVVLIGCVAGVLVAMSLTTRGSDLGRWVQLLATVGTVGVGATCVGYARREAVRISDRSVVVIRGSRRYRYPTACAVDFAVFATEDLPASRVVLRLEHDLVPCRHGSKARSRRWAACLNASLSRHR